MTPGDIVLFRILPHSGWFKKLIGWGERRMGDERDKKAYCHCAIVATATTIIEATWPRVRQRAFDPRDRLDVEIFRVQGITPQQVGSVLAYAYACVHKGELYNLTGLLTFGLIQILHSAVCSQFVWQAFTGGGIVLCPYETLSTPDDIGNSPLLIRVP